MKSQLHGTDELGWALDVLLEIAEGAALRPNLSAVRRAHVRLTELRAERDKLRSRLAEIEKIHAALSGSQGGAA